MSMKFLPKAASALAILGVASGVAQAQTTFGVNATVQNALTVVNEADMALGTLFAVDANSTAYKYVVLSPAGTYAEPVGNAAITLLTLGGQSAARGSVAVGNTTSFVVTLPDAEVAPGAASDNLNTLGASGNGISDTVVGSGIEVRLADPGVARFYLVNFRAGSVSGGASSADCGTGNSCTLTPSFGSTSVSFGVGATIVTDLGGRTAYEADPGYTGSFEVTASY